LYIREELKTKLYSEIQKRICKYSARQLVIYIHIYQGEAEHNADKETEIERERELKTTMAGLQTET
jgi:hypothetical protein